MTDAKKDMLDKIKHARLIADLEYVCSTAGVMEKYLHESMLDHCGDVEVDWVRNYPKYRAEGVPGLLLHGISNPDTRCQSIAAALLRNYTDARVIPLNSLIDMHTKDLDMSPTVLLIPNLYMTTTGRALVAWRQQVAYDILLERSTKGKPTVAYVESMEGVKSSYGQPFSDFLTKFIQVK